MRVREQLLRHRAQIYAIQWNLVPFVAPEDFNPDAEEINIYNEFIYYVNVNKRLVFSVSNAVSTTVLTESWTYYYGEYVSGNMVYNTMGAGTITWTTGSTKRHVFVTGTPITTVAIPSGAIWVYVSSMVTGITHSGNTLKYVHTYDTSSFSTSGGMGTALTGILNLPKNTTYIAVNGFPCTGLIGILVIPDSVTSIGINGFSVPNCTGLVLSNSLVSIGNNAFLGASKITGTLSLPNSLTSIGTGVFSGCTGFTGNLIIPTGLTVLTNWLFQFMTGLNGYIRIHAGVTSIGSDTFKSCSNITMIYNHATTPQPITSDPFSGVSKAKPLHVPVGCAAAYRANAYWNLFTNIIEDL